MSLKQLTEVEGKTDIYSDNTTQQKYRCKILSEFTGSKTASGYFFGQGKRGEAFGHMTYGIIIGAAIVFGFLAEAVSSKGSHPIRDVIHIFGLNIINILVLILIFGLAPFGFFYWLGTCVNNHPGEYKDKLQSWLPKIPLVASILSVIYPASLIFSGNITNWIHQTVLYGLMIFFGGMGAIEYWPAYIRNRDGGTCNISGNIEDRKEFTASGFHFLIFGVFCIMASFILLLAWYWAGLAFGGKIDWTHGLNPFGFIRNILITGGLFITNIVGGLKVFEATKDTLVLNTS